MLDERTLLKKVKLKFSGLTYKEISEKTGLNISRVFRIFNGSKITYSEALLMYNLIGANKDDFNFIFVKNHNQIKRKIERINRLELIVAKGDRG